jgi:hypothetical protein
MLKPKRIAPGFYYVIHNGIEYQIARFEAPGHVWWGWAKAGEACNDAHPSFKAAIQALAEWLDKKV